MTSKERLLAAIRFEGPDRVPVSPRLWRYMLAHDGSQSLETYLTNAERYDFDPLLGVSAGPTWFIPAPGADYSRLGDGISVDVRREKSGDFEVVRRTFTTPAGRISDRISVPKPRAQFGIAPNSVIEEHLVKGPEDLEALNCLLTAWTSAGRTPDYRAISQRVGGRGLVTAGTSSAVSNNAGDAYPLASMMIDCLDRPSFVHELIGVFQRLLMAQTKAALEAGAEMVYCSTYFESMSSGWGPRIYREFFLPRIKEHVELTHEYGALYHLYDDGNMRQTLPMWREIGVDLVSTVSQPPSGDVTLAEARELAGGETCLNGGIDTVHVVWRGSPADIDREIKQAIEQAASPEGGYIVGTSDSITEQTPEENFKTFFESARRHGSLR